MIYSFNINLFKLDPSEKTNEMKKSWHEHIVLLNFVFLASVFTEIAWQPIYDCRTAGARSPNVRTWVLLTAVTSCDIYLRFWSKYELFRYTKSAHYFKSCIKVIWGFFSLFHLTNEFKFYRFVSLCDRHVSSLPGLAELASNDRRSVSSLGRTNTLGLRS